MSLVLYDTMRREKVPFEPREPGQAAVYVCGPTVQGDSHIGHGRAFLVFDVLRRWLIHSGYDVRFVVNVTDVDDKIIRRAAAEGVEAHEIAVHYTQAWNEAMEALGIMTPTVQPLATEHIPQMQELIRELLNRGNAYVSEGNVLFRVRTFEGYGKLSGRRVDELKGGEDVVAADVKEDPLDFAMWKAAKPGEPAWESPWGPGRPGWHIECSAMAATHLGHAFDIHGGGQDLIFPHHENEITQYEAAHGAPFAKYWVHNGMVQMDEDKMSKSVGNVVPLVEAAHRWGRGPLRLWYLSAHHRSPLLFDGQRLDESVSAHDRLVTFVRTVELVALDVPTQASDPDWADAFMQAMDDDLNAPRAVAVLHDIATEGFELLKRADTDTAAAARVRSLAATLTAYGDEVLGLDIREAVDATLRELERRRAEVEPLLAERERARTEREFDRADEIREALTAAGIVVEDRPTGPIWWPEPVR